MSYYRPWQIPLTIAVAIFGVMATYSDRGSNQYADGRRYSLSDMLLAFVLLSGLFAMLVRLPPQVRWDWFGYSAVFAAAKFR